ncbi:ricin B-type lectin domain-containing protein [Encephalitozoon hellem]|uniref:Ricin B-type lectin domain-containing protein n=1 Tax=Encephalitozoon hellem TaxID=27973 RepID=A0ABY8CPZ1_ENCHE|nr:ricin B-type lectin domain-containing protein [Encephalitozoon hellem]
MRKTAIIFQLIKTISGFSIFTKNGTRRHLTKGGHWWSTDYGINYQLAAMSTTGSPSEFKSEELSPGIKVIKEVNSDYVLDLHHPKNGKTKLIYHSRNDGFTQKFEIGGNMKDGYTIKNEDLCLEYDDSGSIYGATCSENSRQKFDVIYSPEDPEYKPSLEENGSVMEIPNTPNASQILIFNETSKSKDKYDEDLDEHSHRHHHHHHHHHPHESPYFTYQKYSDQIIA